MLIVRNIRWLCGLSLVVLLMWAHSIFAASSDGEAGGRSEYILGSGDIVRVHVYGEPDLSFDMQLSDSGVISYPFLGELSFVGLSAGGLENKISRGLDGDYLIEPRVTVTILQYRDFFINGQVNRPGGVPFQPGLTIRKAVSLAGGFTERASKRNIFLISDNDPDKKQKRVGLDAAVNPGDIITVEQSFF